jgi:hypothetical protein
MVMPARKISTRKSGSWASKPKGKAKTVASGKKSATKKTAAGKGPKYAPTRKAPVAGTVSRKKIRDAIRSTM